jgi:phosphatidylserine/phosphatidylglycerophosphate/cardiolipin synthase-like enzyme
MLTTRVSLTLFDLPDDDALAQAAILALINGAKKRVVLLMYSLTIRPIIEALIAAHARGVDVKCMLDRSQATDLYNSAATARLVAGIGAENVCIGTTPNGAIVHSKLCGIDGKHWIGGSANLTVSGLVKETNVVLIATSAKLVADLEARMAALVAWNTAHPHVPATAMAAPPDGEEGSWQ